MQTKDPIVTAQHQEVRERVRHFAEQEVAPQAAALDESETFSADLTKRMGEEGLLGIYIDESYGGAGLDYLSLIIAVEELARVDGSQAATVASHNSLGIGPIYNFGSHEQKERFLPKLTTGDHVWGFGMTEPKAGSDSRGTEMQATLQNDHWRINGRKIYISNSASEISLGTTMQVITDEEEGRKEYSAILVESDRQGFVRKKMDGKMMWRASDTGTLELSNVWVPENNLLGERGKGSGILLQTLDSGRLTIAAMGLGLAQGAYEQAMAHAKKRKQFGRPIGKFQAIAFKLADMALKIEHARNTLYRAVWLKDNKQPFGKEAAMAKLYCSEVAAEVSNEAVQVLGAYGLTKPHPVERFYRDQRVLQIGEGTSEILRLVISRQIGLDKL
jgi:alkylation response protein AidB-like acyl-CoA dehydrogenase